MMRPLRCLNGGARILELQRRVMLPLTRRSMSTLDPPGTSESSSSTSQSSSFLHKMYSLEGRSCIVTGGGTGIGAVLAMGLARAGAHVILTGRREAMLEDTCNSILSVLKTEDGIVEPRVHYHTYDITRYDLASDLIKAAEYMANGIPPTILVNNAGVNVRQKACDLTSEHWHQSLDLMLIAPFMLARSMSVNMKNAEYGRIITLASLQSYRAFPDSIPYAAAKSGILGLTRGMAEAYSPHYGYNNITCNAVAPGYVKTELTAAVFADEDRIKKLADCTILGRNSMPDDLVGTVIFLASPASSYITGQTINVDGGFTALGLR